jgi:hypothetical protein
MLWELTRLSRWETTLRIGFMCFFTILLSLINPNLGEIQNQVIRGISVGFFLVTAPFSSAWLGELDSKSTGFSFRLGYVRPVSTLQLVLIPMIFTVAIAMASYLIPALFASLLLNTSFPLLEPALLVALVVQFSMAVVWSFTTRLARIFGIVLLAVVIIGLCIYSVMHSESNVPLLLAISDPSYFEMSLWQFACLIAVMFATTIATIFSVDRQRHGDEWKLFRTSWCFLFSSSSLHSAGFVDAEWRPFQNRVTAQCWYEWRQTGIRVLTAGFITAFLAVGFLTVINLLYPGRNPNTVVWVIALIISPLLLQVIGIESAVGLKHVHGTTKLSAFDATRCFANDQIILIKLVVIAFCATISWLCLLTIAWIDLGWFGRADAWQNNHVVSDFLAKTLPKISAHLGAREWIIGFFNLILLFISSSSALLAFALWMPIYPKRFTAIALVGALHLLVAVLAVVKKWPIEFAGTCYGYALAGLITSLCLISVQRSIKFGAIRKIYFMAIGSLWVIATVPSVYFYYKISAQLPFTIPPAGIVFGAALLLVPLASTTVAPLAYATHRNG